MGDDWNAFNFYGDICFRLHVGWFWDVRVVIGCWSIEWRWFLCWGDDVMSGFVECFFVVEDRVLLCDWCWVGLFCGGGCGVVVDVDGNDWELSGGAVVLFPDRLVVKFDVLYDLFFLDVGVDGDGVWCEGNGFCGG